MAEDKNIAFSIKIDGVERSIESLKDLKQAKKDATDAFLRGDKDAAKALADLKDKTEDLTDATQTLKGSGVEKINSSFSQLGEGLRTLDTEKIKTGFKGIGAAMSAIPIFLLIEGLKYLVENFDEVSKAVKNFFNITSDAEKQVKSLEKAVLSLKDANSLLISSLENEVKILEAQGASHDKLLAVRQRIITEKIKEAELDVQLQKAKIAEILSNDSLIESYYKVSAANARRFGDEKAAAVFEALLAKEKNARVKEATDLLRADLITIQNLKTESQVQEIKRDNEITAEHKKQNNDKLASDKKYLEDKQKAENEAWALTLQIRASNREAQASDDKRIADEVKAQKAIDDAAWMEGARLQSEQVKAIAYSESDLKNQLREQELESFKTNYQAQLNTAQSLTTSLSSLSDSYFYFKRKNLEKGSAEDLKQAKKQFDINKGLAIASATISGIQGVVNALSAQSIIPEPYGTVLKVVTAAAVGAAAVANIAKIASSKFDAGGGGGGGGGAAAAPISIPAPPSISTATNNVNKGTSFDETGKKIGGEEKTPTVQVKATIGVDEVSNKQNRVDTLEKQSTF